MGFGMVNDEFTNVGKVNYIQFVGWRSERGEVDCIGKKKVLA